MERQESNPRVFRYCATPIETRIFYPAFAFHISSYSVSFGPVPVTTVRRPYYEFWRYWQILCSGEFVSILWCKRIINTTVLPIFFQKIGGYSLACNFLAVRLIWHVDYTLSYSLTPPSNRLNGIFSLHNSFRAQMFEWVDDDLLQGIVPGVYQQVRGFLTRISPQRNNPVFAWKTSRRAGCTSVQQTRESLFWEQSFWKGTLIHTHLR